MSEDRFDNIATADLVDRWRETRAEVAALESAVRARLIAEAGIETGRVYRVADDERSLAGRLIWVEGVNAGIGWLGPGAAGSGADGKGFRCFAWGRLNGRSAAGDGWTIKRQQVTASRLRLVEP